MFIDMYLTLHTFREQRLLIDSDNSSVFAKQIVARTVGHELAHQWFGNLVGFSMLCLGIDISSTL